MCTAPRWLRAAAELAVVAAEISGLLTLSQLRDPLGGHSSSPREVPVLQLRLAAKVAAEISGLLTISQLCDPLGGHSSVVELRDDDRLAE